MRRAQFCVSLFALCFNFWHCMYNSCVTLFFAVLLWTACFIFQVGSTLVTNFVVHRFVSVSLATFSQFPLLCFASSCAPGFLDAIFWQKHFALWCSRYFLRIFWLGLVLAFFACKISVLQQFIFAHFGFCLYFLRLFAFALLIRSYPSHLQPLPVQNYAYYFLCSFFWQAQR